MSRVEDLAEKFLSKGSNRREVKITELVKHFEKFECAGTPVFSNIGAFVNGKVATGDGKEVKIKDTVTNVEYGYYDRSTSDILFIIMELLAEYDELDIVVDDVAKLKEDPDLYYPLYTWDLNGGGENGPWVYRPESLVIPNDFTLEEIKELIQKVNMEDNPKVIIPVKEEYDANEISEFYGDQNVIIFSPSKVREKIVIPGFENIPKKEIACVSEMLDGNENNLLKAFISSLEDKLRSPKQADVDRDSLLTNYYKIILEIYYRISSGIKDIKYLYVDLVNKQFGASGLNTMLEILAVISVFKNVEIIFPEKFDSSLEQTFVNAICEINSGIVGSLPNRVVRALKMREALMSPMSVLIEDKILLNTKYYKGSLLGVRGNADCYVIPLRKLYTSIESRNFGTVGVLLSTVKKTSELQFTNSSSVSESECVHLVDPTFFNGEEGSQSIRFQNYGEYAALRKDIISKESEDNTPFPFPKDFSGTRENSFREVVFNEKKLQESRIIFEDSLLSQIEYGLIDIDGYERSSEEEDTSSKLRLTDWICNPNKEAVEAVRKFARDLFPSNSFEQEPNEELMVRRLLGIDLNSDKSPDFSSNKTITNFSHEVGQKQIEVDGAYRSIGRLKSSTHEQIEFYSALCSILSKYLSKELRPDGKRYNYVTVNDLMLGVKDLEGGGKELYIVFYPMRETYPCWINKGAAISVKNAELGIVFPNNLSINPDSKIIDNLMKAVISETKSALKDGSVSFFVDKDFIDFEIFMEALSKYDDTMVFSSDPNIVRVSVYNESEPRKALIDVLKESVEWEDKEKQQLLTLYFFATKYVGCKIKCLNELYEQKSMKLPGNISFEDLPSVMEWNTASYYNAIGSRNLDELNDIIPVSKSIDLCRVINPFGGVLRDDAVNPGKFTEGFEILKFLCMHKVGNNGTRQPINGEFK